MKEQDKTPQEELSEEETGSLSGREYKVMTVDMIKELGRRMNEQSKKFLLKN